jgi:hypothetical protein
MKWNIHKRYIQGFTEGNCRLGMITIRINQPFYPKKESRKIAKRYFSKKCRRYYDKILLEDYVKW